MNSLIVCEMGLGGKYALRVIDVTQRHKYILRVYCMVSISDIY